MDTFFARNRLSAYLDGSLSDSESAEVEAALSDDESLRREYDTMREAVELLRTLGPVDAPEGFHARVMSRVEAEPDPGKVVSLWRRTLGRVPVEALALAAAALIVVLVIQGRTGEPADAPADEPAVASTKDVSISPQPPPDPVVQPEQTQQAAAPQAAPAAADGDLRTASRRDVAAPAASKGANKAMSTSAKGMDSAPDEPYVTGWEQAAVEGAQVDDLQVNTGGAELSNGVDMEGPRSYRISMADSMVLAQLSAVAERSGGRLTDSSGDVLRKLEPAEAGKTTWVHIVVPQAEATKVEGYLTGMGAVPTPPPPSNVLYGSDYTVFVVQVTGSN